MKNLLEFMCITPGLGALWFGISAFLDLLELKIRPKLNLDILPNFAVLFVGLSLIFAPFADHFGPPYSGLSVLRELGVGLALVGFGALAIVIMLVGVLSIVCPQEFTNSKEEFDAVPIVLLGISVLACLGIATHTSFLGIVILVPCLFVTGFLLAVDSFWLNSPARGNLA